MVQYANKYGIEKEHRVKKTLAIVLWVVMLAFIGTAGVFADVEDIYWAGSYDEAMEMAQESGLNIFLLITAPSWCYWCQELENNVFSSYDVVEAINYGYVPVRVLDTDDDVYRFDFEGYPTVWIMTPFGEQIADIYTQDPYEMADYLDVYSGGGYGYGGVDDMPYFEWDQVPDAAMYGGADWSGELYRERGISLEDAKAIAGADEAVTFFFYMKGAAMTLPGKGTFRKGDAVFFSGDPWWGDAKGLADGYVKYYGY